MTAGMVSRLTLRRATAVGILTFAAGALTFGAHAQQAVARQSVDEVRAAARELILKTLGTDTNAVVEAVGIDERLSLPACTQQLDAQLRGELRNGQGVVVVSCAGKSAWRLFVPVRVSEQIGVVIARRSISAGEILTADDLADPQAVLVGAALRLHRRSRASHRPHRAARDSIRDGTGPGSPRAPGDHRARRARDIGVRRRIGERAIGRRGARGRPPESASSGSESVRPRGGRRGRSLRGS